MTEAEKLCERLLTHFDDCPPRLGEKSFTRPLMDEAAAMIAAQAEEIARLREVVLNRRAIYAARHDAADPSADDDCNRQERIAHTVEAFDHLLAEIKALSPNGGG